MSFVRLNLVLPHGKSKWCAVSKAQHPPQWGQVGLTSLVPGVALLCMCYCANSIADIQNGKNDIYRVVTLTPREREFTHYGFNYEGAMVWKYLTTNPARRTFLNHTCLIWRDYISPPPDIISGIFFPEVKKHVREIEATPFQRIPYKWNNQVYILIPAANTKT